MTACNSAPGSPGDQSTGHEAFRCCKLTLACGLWRLLEDVGGDSSLSKPIFCVDGCGTDGIFRSVASTAPIDSHEHAVNHVVALESFDGSLVESRAASGQIERAFVFSRLECGAVLGKTLSKMLVRSK